MRYCPRTKHAALALATTGAVVAALALTGCGVDAIEDVSTAGKSVKQTTNLYLTTEEWNQLVALNPEATYDRQVERDGTTYYLITDTTTFEGDNLQDALAVIDGDKCVFYTVGNEGGVMAPEDLGLPTTPNVEFSTVTANFDKTPLASNGTISDNSVFFDSLTAPKGTQAFWTVFTEKAANAKSITANLKQGALTNKQNVKVSSPGAITTLTLNGESAIPLVNTGKNADKLTIYFIDEGKQKVKLGLSNGYTKTFTYTCDWTAPKVNVKKGKAYKAGKKLTVKDKNGFKKVTLNGKKLQKSGKKVTKSIKKAGTYTLKATDKAGNVTKVKFKIKKK